MQTLAPRQAEPGDRCPVVAAFAVHAAAGGGGSAAGCCALQIECGA
jgi:hypothetical protein